MQKIEFLYESASDCAINTEKLSWERLDDKRASRIALYHLGAITEDQEKLTQLQAWATEAANRFYNALAEAASQALHAIE